MKLSYTSLLLFIPVVFLAACTKHKGDIPDHIPTATLSIVKPVEGAVFTVGDSVAIQGKAISSEVIHGYDVIIKKANDTTTYFLMHVHEHNDTLLIDQKWKASVSAGMSLEAVITLALDHDGHTLTRRAAFSVK